MSESKYEAVGILINEKPKRIRLQLHLSTVVTLTLITGLLLLFQLDGRREVIIGGGPGSGPSFDNVMSRPMYGWPLDAVIEEKYRSGRTEFEFETSGMIIDGAASLILIVGTALVSEWLIRRSEARKT